MVFARNSLERKEPPTFWHPGKVVGSYRPFHDVSMVVRVTVRRGILQVEQAHGM